MAAAKTATDQQGKSTGEVVSDLWSLLKEYGRQETIDPLKNLKRFLTFGLAGALCFGLAGTFMAIGVLRIFQVEGVTWANGNWWIAVYVASVAFLALSLFVSIKQIKKGKAS